MSRTSCLHKHGTLLYRPMTGYWRGVREFLPQGTFEDVEIDPEYLVASWWGRGFDGMAELVMTKEGLKLEIASLYNVPSAQRDPDWYMSLHQLRIQLFLLEAI